MDSSKIEPLSNEIRNVINGRPISIQRETASSIKAPLGNEINRDHFYYRKLAYNIEKKYPKVSSFRCFFGVLVSYWR